MNIEQVEKIINAHPEIDKYIRRRVDEARQLKREDKYCARDFVHDIANAIVHAGQGWQDPLPWNTCERKLIEQYVCDTTGDALMDVDDIPSYVLFRSAFPEHLEDRVNELLSEDVCKLINCTTFFADGQWCAQVVYIPY